ncbi:DUF1622 domain-containing protein [Parafrankia sp. BMG5.11]|uniref:DUF1622 domain-containing protein n=1 Tax=Parafrankia sp. BMG5.11 TaxID=222540 RepID=UPI00104051AF|nr:DUF1622 domain-containing protein [Parafrankia sp. BMG5.11]TCJ40942.1 DUF1622 domain-containing protein [Parafrankia sp. BMG5.11]
MEHWIREFTLATSLVVEGIAALIVAFAVAEAVARLVMSIPRHSGAAPGHVSHGAKEEIRLRLGRWLALALELLLGADILRTAVAPTWSEIGQLAAVAAIRTLLNFFLQREIAAEEVRKNAQRAKPDESDGRGGAADPTAE